MLAPSATLRYVYIHRGPAGRTRHLSIAGVRIAKIAKIAKEESAGNIHTHTGGQRGRGAACAVTG